MADHRRADHVVAGRRLLPGRGARDHAAGVLRAGARERAAAVREHPRARVRPRARRAPPRSQDRGDRPLAARWRGTDERAPKDRRRRTALRARRARGDRGGRRDLRRARTRAADLGAGGAASRGRLSGRDQPADPRLQPRSRVPARRRPRRPGAAVAPQRRHRRGHQHRRRPRAGVRLRADRLRRAADFQRRARRTVVRAHRRVPRRRGERRATPGAGRERRSPAFTRKS